MSSDLVPSADLGHTIHPLSIYRNAINGMALDLTPAEAAELAKKKYRANHFFGRIQRLNSLSLVTLLD